MVLGAGLAGLTAAYNLMRRGHDVVLLEAQELAGGRVKTVREPFVNGGYAEAGALRIFDGDVTAPVWPRGSAGVAELDHSRLGDYLRGNGAREGWLRYFAALEGDLAAVNTAQGLAA